MESSTLLLVSLFLFLVVFLYVLRRRLNPLNKMPGPPRLPVVGNLHQMDLKRPHLTMTSWSLQYGPVYRVTMGVLGDVVVACGAAAVREALMDRELAGRPRTFRAGCISNKYRNVGFGDPTCPEWKPLRNAVRKEIKATDAVGLRRLETATLRAMDELSVDLVKAGQAGRLPIDAREILYIATLNIISAFLVGDRFNKSDIEFQLFERMERIGVTLITSAGGGGAELDAFPWLRHFGHPVLERMREYEQLRDELYERMKQRAEQHAVSSGAMTGENPLIFTLLELIKSHASSADGATDKNYFTEEHIKGTFSDLIMGGTASTTNLTYALINLLLHDRQVYERLKTELSSVAKQRAAEGQADRRVTLSDRASMPYTQATVLELLRYVSIAPFAVPHKALSDTTLCGHVVPRHTEVIINLWSVHHEQSFWKDPERFDPDRFLQLPSRAALHPPDHPARRHLIPFGAGQRRCIGEAFALSRLFLIVANLLDDFDVMPPTDTTTAADLVSCSPLTYELGIAFYPLAFHARLVPTSSCMARLQTVDNTRTDRR